MKACPSLTFTFGCRVGLTRITPYWLNRFVVALDENFEVVLVGEGQPGPPIGQRVSLFPYRRVQRRAHA